MDIGRHSLVDGWMDIGRYSLVEGWMNGSCGWMDIDPPGVCLAH